jgi:Flp pilus assembly protein TadG
MRQRGQAIVLVALMLGVVVGMAALAIDGSRAYATRRDLQAAVDAAALAAADNIQRTGSYTQAEQAASTSFGTNLRLYTAPSCSPGYGNPGASPYTLTCTYSDATTLNQVVTAQGPRGSLFALTGSRPLQLQFGRILTNGSTPLVSTTGGGRVNNLLYAPTLAALNQAGCGGMGGSAISISGSGTLSVTGDVVASGAISVSTGAVRVGGDVYARCQSSVSGTTTGCYPSGASSPCTYPDVVGAVRSGYHYVDPRYPAPSVVGGSQGAPNSTIALQPGIYAALPAFNSGDCWFLSGGVYDWQAGFANSGDFVSNELKPPDEPDPVDNTERSNHQFWNTNGVNCSGSAQFALTSGPRGIPTGDWAFVITSTRTDTYSGVSYPRESAPSMCNVVHVNNSGVNILLTVSNVPGATSYNIYAAPPPNGCSGRFGLAEQLAVSVPVLNTNTNPCPAFNGNGCTLGHESITLDSGDLGAPFAPSSLAAPGAPDSYPPNSETAGLSGSLPNQNPGRLAGAAGDRANENNCETGSGAYATCPTAVTPGAVEFYLPGSACLTNTNAGDTYVFSGYQYNWMSVYEPISNGCANTLGASSNTAFVGLVYTPGATMTVSSSRAFEVAATGGLIADTITFNGTLPSISFGSGYAPVPFAARLVS